MRPREQGVELGESSSAPCRCTVALGYSHDSPLAKMMTNARWARFADGADEVHPMKIAEALIASYRASGSVNEATGALPV